MNKQFYYHLKELGIMSLIVAGLFLLGRAYQINSIERAVEQVIENKTIHQKDSFAYPILPEQNTYKVIPR